MSKNSTQMSNPEQSNIINPYSIAQWREQVNALITADEPSQLRALLTWFYQVKGSDVLAVILNNAGPPLHPLFIAKLLKSIECFEVLLQAEVPHDVRLLYDFLIDAVNRGQLYLVALLLKHGADPSYMDQHTSPPLHHLIRDREYCLRFGDDEARYLALEVLLDDPRINLNQYDSLGYTPLTTAINGRDPRCVQMLLARGVDLSLRTQGHLPIEIARELVSIFSTSGSNGATRGIHQMIEREMISREWKRVFGEVKGDLRLRGLVDDLFGIVNDYLVY